MSTPANLNKQDEAIRKALSDIEQQIEGMITAGRTVERIKQELASGYISGASSTFQQKVEDWMTRYHTVIGAFERFAESTKVADQVLSHAEEEARLHAADGIVDALNGA
ncbi:hypothetical protein ACFVUY_23925 [Kitasatospora sp. NPDC058063]|uniref:hypothetical protein n=1 Tax=unclassified Kitasatospora TaxID=2633591 RepID=UPI003381FDE5